MDSKTSHSSDVTPSSAPPPGAQWARLEQGPLGLHHEEFLSMAKLVNNFPAVSFFVDTVGVAHSSAEFIDTLAAFFKDQIAHGPLALHPADAIRARLGDLASASITDPPMPLSDPSHERVSELLKRSRSIGGGGGEEQSSSLGEVKGPKRMRTGSYSLAKGAPVEGSNRPAAESDMAAATEGFKSVTPAFPTTLADYELDRVLAPAGVAYYSTRNDYWAAKMAAQSAVQKMQRLRVEHEEAFAYFEPLNREHVRRGVARRAAEFAKDPVAAEE
ncbi:hypothetical protein LTR37_014081 [Vermiconidia calcicola]|uniref:Uncharacterized protein n=1 Tax=Vermiconidia calcicola TaxID=1690605 RepID=A0ACC3MUJ4_9PEZI|nr:hypothetical protein LTR37_014081 [Vermiconidia calcicola]